MIKELGKKLTNSWPYLENKLDINPIKEKMNKLFKLDHDNKNSVLNLLYFGIKEKQHKETLEILKE